MNTKVSAFTESERSINTVMIRFHITICLFSLDIPVTVMIHFHITICLFSKGPPELYSLYALLIHEGHSAGSGHYTSVVKSGNKWFYISDGSVSKRV